MNQPKFVGVDTHQKTIACYVDNRFKEFPVSIAGFKAAIKWSQTNNWAIEGAYCFGRPLAEYLIKKGHNVYEVNPLLTKNWRQALTINGKKNDYGDAKVISLFANSNSIKPVSFLTTNLREKLTARKLLVKQRTQIISSIKILYSSRGKFLPMKNLTTSKALEHLLKIDDSIIQSYAKLLIEQNRLIKYLEKEIEKTLPEKAKVLTLIKGIKTITAATIYAYTEGKSFNKSSLASYCGVAPVEYSSGKKSCHRNNRFGNRELNSIFYRLSICQSIYDESGKSYYEKKLSEGKSKRHARKCLARQLVTIVWKRLNR